MNNTSIKSLGENCKTKEGVAAPKKEGNDKRYLLFNSLLNVYLSEN